MVNWKSVLWFVIGCLVGMWMSYNDTQKDPSPEECLNVCVEQFEKMGC